MNVLLLSETAELRPLYFRLEGEGHLTFLYNNNPRATALNLRVDVPPRIFGNGVIEFPNELGRLADVVISTIPNSTALLSEGAPVIGGRKFNALMRDKKYLKRTLIAAGLEFTEDTDSTLTVVGWFNGYAFVEPFFTMRVKSKFMAGDAGLDVGCACAVMHECRDVKLCEKTITRLDKILAEVGYVGALQMKITEDQQPKVISVETEPSIVHLAMLGELIREPISRFLIDIAHKKERIKLPVRHEWVGCVLASMPPFPYDIALPSGELLETIEKEALKHLWICDVVSVDNSYLCGGNIGVLGYATARGGDLEIVRSRILRTLKRIELNNIQYRNDIGS